jgi:pimeloyl-ACP methyl ester carboxylesterase
VAVTDHDGWTFREAGSGDTTVLLLPGALCTEAFYSDVLADPALAGAGVRFVAATPPGFGGNPPPPGFDMSVSSYADLLEAEADALGCSALVGHSYFANVLIEVAARARFGGPLVLLSPCFSREDEEKDMRQLNAIARVPGVGAFVFWVAPRTLNGSMKGRFPPARHDELVAEMKRGLADGGLAREFIKRYFDSLDEPGSLAERLASSGAAAWVVRGDSDEVGLTDAEAAVLEAAPSVTTVSIPDARHFSMTDQPAAVTRVILEALGVTDSSPD